MKILTFSTLFPNVNQQRHGIFVRIRLARLIASGKLTARVLAPVPWVPYSGKLSDRYINYRDIPSVERCDGIEVLHPRYLSIPRVGMSMAPFLLALSAARSYREAISDCDLVDANYYYPDGVAAALLGLWFGKPLVITALGSDINLIMDHAIPGRLILWAERRSGGTITVSRALKERLVRAGVGADRIRVLRNGVDLDLFRPGDRGAIRARLGLNRFTALSVGNLVEGKGHHIAIEALSMLDDVDLVIVGDGVMRRELEREVSERSLEGRIRFTGNVTQEQLSEYYNAADCLVLPSAREGMPNVVLESLACGTPVIATSVGGIPEIIRPPAGLLMRERTASSLKDALLELMSSGIDRAAVREYATGYGWDEVIDEQLEFYNDVLAGQGK